MLESKALLDIYGAALKTCAVYQAYQAFKRGVYVLLSSSSAAKLFVFACYYVVAALHFAFAACLLA